MTAATLNGVSNVHLTLLTDTDKGERTGHTGKYAVANRAAFVEYETGGNAALLKELNDTVRSVTVDFLVTTEGKINIILGYKALVNKSLSRLENSVKSTLGIKSSASPKEAVVKDSLEGRLFPILLLHAYNVIMSHINAGGLIGLTLPSDKDTAITNLLKGALLEYSREKGGKKLLKFLKLRLVIKAGINMGDGFASDHLCKVTCSLLTVYKHGRNRACGGLGGLKKARADKNHRNKNYKSNRKNQHHILYYSLLVKNSGESDGKEYSYGYHNTNHSCVKRGNEYEENEHKSYGSNSELPILGDKSHTKCAEERRKHLIEGRLQCRVGKKRLKGHDKEHTDSDNNNRNDRGNRNSDGRDNLTLLTLGINLCVLKGIDSTRKL
jgi:hypothetical protein